MDTTPPTTTKMINPVLFEDSEARRRPDLNDIAPLLKSGVCSRGDNEETEQTMPRRRHARDFKVRLELPNEFSEHLVFAL